MGNNMFTITSLTYIKGLVIILVIIGVLAGSRFLNTYLSRLQKRFIAKLKTKDVASVSSIETKIAMARKIIKTGLYFLACVIFLLQFEQVRSIGTGLLASAGVAGIVIGMAAQSTLSNVIGGIYISFAQPVRLEDAVIFENDFGWVEEISLMHTIIRTWDNRRIVVLNNVLVNKVMQNWTIKDPTLLGVVMMYVDYTCDVDTVRKWVTEIVEKSAFTTKEKVAGLQVVDFTEKTMVLRILSKGPDAPSTWNLRCEIREQLIQRFMKEKMPLPRIRLDEASFSAHAPK